MQDFSSYRDRFINSIPVRDYCLEKFRDSFDLWIESLSDEVRPIVLDLLEHFDYYAQQVVNQYLVELHKTLQDDYSVNDVNAVHTFIPKERGKADSSYEYLYNYKIANGIYKKSISNNLNAINEEEWERITEIVIIDDFCGSGGTLTRFFDTINRDFKGKTIYYLTIHLMKDAFEVIKKNEEKYQTRIIPVTCNIRDKAFNLESLGKYDNAKEIVKRFSREKGIPRNRVFGLKKTEALAAFYNNTPNNTLGIFGYSTEYYEAPFARQQEPDPDWVIRPTPNKMKADKHRRKQKNYNAERDRKTV